MAVVTTRATAHYVCHQCRRIGSRKWFKGHLYAEHGETTVGKFATMMEFLYEISISAGHVTYCFGEPVTWSTLSGAEEYESR